MRASFLLSFLFLIACGGDSDIDTVVIDQDVIFFEAVDNSGCSEIPELLDMKKIENNGYESLDEMSVVLYLSEDETASVYTSEVTEYIEDGETKYSYRALNSYSGVFNGTDLILNDNCIFNWKE